MSKDYANKSPHKEHKPIPGWIWLLAGLIIGLFVALLVYINDNSSGNQKLSETVANVFKDKNKTEARGVKQSKAQAPTLNKENKTKFDFYTILPELEVAIPESELLNTFINKKETEVQHNYMLQAGSFRKFTEADSLKAQLALQGIEANIQEVKINDKDTWYRVRVGPLTTMKSLNSSRRRLRDLGIASIVVKNKK